MDYVLPDKLNYCWQNQQITNEHLKSGFVGYKRMKGKSVNMLHRTSIYNFISATLTIFFVSTSNAMAYEEPEYKLIKSTDVYEIRHYEERLAVKTTQSKSQIGAFRRLFNYISGSNESSSKIAMTVPVIQSKDISGTSMIFFLPKIFTKQSAPLPDGDDVELITVKGGFYAITKYSGRSTDRNYIKHSTRLFEALRKDNILTIGDPVMATYNGPFTLPFMRRNEAMYRVNWK
ncbi:heme-binding protein [Planktomarina sp.]|uniref:SOUL family heme-binding protein n=1 Tax=uncultured Planktomarina sp. TaxID=1538529 RepID=UPI00236E3814|nr:heme-binding protein [Planktomarina sp.]